MNFDLFENEIKRLREEMIMKLSRIMKKILISYWIMKWTVLSVMTVVGAWAARNIDMIR